MSKKYNKSSTKKKLKKGERGYIDSRKKNQLIMTLVYILIGIAIFVIGLLLNKFEKTNIFTVISVLMVLPATKRFVNFIVFCKYKSVDKKLYEKISEKITKEDTLYTDVVFTSTEHIMFLSFLVISGNEIIGLSLNESQHIKDAKKLDDIMLEYLKERMQKMEYSYKVIIAKSVEAFLSAYSSVNKEIKVDEKEAEDVKDFIYASIVE